MGTAVTSSGTRGDVTCTDGPASHTGSERRLLALQQALPLTEQAPVRCVSGMTLGRGSECTVRVASDRVSRKHATIHWRAPLWWCEDCDSRNGTFINGKRAESCPVGPGDVLRCGDHVWSFVRAPGATDTDGDAVWNRLGSRLYGGRQLCAAMEPARLAAGSQLPIILQGDTGVGKECAAVAIHEWSQRRGDFVAVNCAALPASLAEAELFGYRRGAFTGADKPHTGFFRAAHNGTLLLDEICELPPPIQAKLLRVIEQGEVVPLGEARPVPVQVRLIAAAQQPLAELAEQGRFRADLLARLSGLIVRLPPLRERKEDIPHLFALFLKQLDQAQQFRLHPRFVEALLLHRFPNNVRGLQQLARQLVLTRAKERVWRRSHLPEEILTEPPGAVKSPSAPSRPDDETSPRAIRRRVDGKEDWPRLKASLQRHQGNVRRAAEETGLSRQQAYRLLKEHDDVNLRVLRRDGEVANGE